MYFLLRIFSAYDEQLFTGPHSKLRSTCIFSCKVHHSLLVLGITRQKFSTTVEGHLKKIKIINKKDKNAKNMTLNILQKKILVYSLRDETRRHETCST